MRPQTIILPFLGFLLSAVAVALKSTYSDIPWLAGMVWGAAFLMFVLWITLDMRGFIRFFSRQGIKYGMSSGSAVLLGCCVIVGLAYVSLLPRFNKGFDMTHYRTNTLADQTVKMVKKLAEQKESLVVKAFFTEEAQKRKFLDLLGMYEIAGLKVQKFFIDPQTNPQQALSENIGSSNTAIVRYGDQEVRLTVFTEEKLTNAILNVLKISVKKVYFSSGHGEGKIDNQDAEGYALAVEQLKGSKFAVEQVDFLTLGKIPEDAQLVVVGGPQYDLKETDIAIFNDYLHKGGAILFMIDSLVPVKQINTLLASRGLAYDDDLLILKSEDSRSRLLGQNNSISSRFDEFHLITRDFAKQSMVAIIAPNSRSIHEIKNGTFASKTEIIVKTSEAVVAITGVKSKKDLQTVDRDRIKPGEFGVVAVAQTPIPQADRTEIAAKEATRTLAKEERIALIGSSYISNNMGCQRTENLDLFMNTINYLTRNEDYIAIAPRNDKPSTLDLSGSSSQMSLLFLAFIYPFIYLGGGTWYWLRRRKA